MKYLAFGCAALMLVLSAWMVFLASQMTWNPGEIVMTPTRIGYGSGGDGLYVMAFFTTVMAFVTVLVAIDKWGKS